MARRAVDLEDGAGLDGGREQPRLVERIPVAVGHQAIGRMRHDLNQRVLHRTHIAVGELRAGLTGRIVQRREHHVEPLEKRVGEVERAIRQDIDFRTMKDGDAGVRLPGRCTASICRSSRSPSRPRAMAEVCE